MILAGDDLGADTADTGEDETLLVAPPARRNSNVSIGQMTTTPKVKREDL